MYFYSARGADCCTDGYYKLQQLLSATTTVPTPPQPLQGLHPELRITCNGNLTEIIYTTILGGSTSSDIFEIWRETSPGSNIYNVAYQASRVSETMFARIDDSISLYSVKVSNYSVHASDFIGFSAFVSSTLRFLDLGNAAPRSIYRSSFELSIDLNSVTTYDTRYFPLITAVIARKSV